MTNIAHKMVIEELRSIAADGAIDMPFVAEYSDERLLRMIFINFRASKGVRLSAFGREILTNIFRSYTFPLPPEFRISPAIIVWLERASPLPYFISSEKITVFEPTLAIRIKLADGDLSLLMAAN